MASYTDNLRSFEFTARQRLIVPLSKAHKFIILFITLFQFLLSNPPAKSLLVLS